MSQPPAPPAPPRQSITLPDEPPAVPLTAQQAHDRNTYIRHTLQRIEQYLAAGLPPHAIEERVPEFKKDFPKLYDTVMTPGYNKQSLQTMLAMLEKMGTGQLSQHTASMIVGQRVYDTFVKPQVDAMPRPAP